jgi:DNA-binding IclR family transcriptional regulator
MNRADRLHLLLSLFTVDKPLWTAEEAASALGVSPSTAYRQFASLLRLGLLEAVDSPRGHVLGPAIIELDRNIRLSDPLIRVAMPAMRWLADQAPVSCTVMLCRLYRDRVMCIHQEEKPASPGDVSYERGRLMPLFRGAPSKTIIAQLTARQLAGVVQRMPEERRRAELKRPLDELRAELQDIRKRGYCITHGEVDADVIGIAMPLRAPRRGIVASLGVACFGRPDDLGLVRVRALLGATVETIAAAIAHERQPLGAPPAPAHPRRR